MANGVRSYTDDELQAILRRALERQAERADGFGHDELVAAAREVGLDEDAVERAIDEISRERGYERIRESLKRRRRERWLRHLVAYLAVVGGLLGLHALALVGAWVFWVAFGWGIGLALDTYGKLRAPTEEEVEREARRIARRERRRRKAQERREAKRRRAEERAMRAKQRHHHHHPRSEASEQLERVIDEGVALLLKVAAKKIREVTEQMEHGQRAPDTEFGRYVERRRQREQGAPEPARGPRVRVEAEAEELEEHALEVERRRRERERRSR